MHNEMVTCGVETREEEDQRMLSCSEEGVGGEISEHFCTPAQSWVEATVEKSPRVLSVNITSSCLINANPFSLHSPHHANP